MRGPSRGPEKARPFGERERPPALPRSRERMANNLLVRGSPGSGKTTLAVKVAEDLTELGFKVAGFVTEEIREGKTRLGFRIRDLRGGEAVMAHVGLRAGPRVGKYTVDVETLERTALRALDEVHGRADLVIVDEIGKMEALSAAFLKRVMELMDLPTPLLATIPKSDQSFVSSLLQRGDVSVYCIDRRNRERMKEVVEEDLLGILGHRRSPRTN